MLFSSRARLSSRALAAGVGLGLVATPLALAAPAANAADPVTINILGINDFHGRLTANGTEAGAAVLAGAVKEIRAAQPNTVFAAAGDLIGASTFDSFIQQDKPTIDALNEAGLEVSAVGNHEFDRGYDDLMKRVIAAESASNPDGGAMWKYLGANVKPKATAPADTPVLDPSWTKTFGTGDTAVTVGFVGAVTEELPSLVSPSGIADITVSDIVAATNTEADKLKAAGSDLVVLLVHEGAPTTDCATIASDPASAFGSIVTGVNDNVDAIVSGHTHLAYDCKVPVAGWAARAVKARPVVSAGQYGVNLNQLTFQVDPADGSIDGLTTAILPLVKTPAYAPDKATADIVSAAVAEANVLGAVELGDLGGDLRRAKANGRDAQGAPALVENRGGESTVGNLVAEVQRSETGAQIAFMNPGGLRADLLGNNTNGYPAALTYRQAANVQPFANTLVNMTMTGAQIKAALEQQWQPAASSRPFLRLGASQGFEHTYDPTAPEGSRVTSMTLDGDPIGAAETFSVTVNSFLASGGDNFGAFAQGTARRDTGKIDLQTMVDYLEKFAADAPLAVDYTQRAVGVDFGDAAPASYLPGDTVAFDLSSLSFSNATDVKDENVTVSLGGTALGTFPVDSALPSLAEGQDPRTTIFDEVGRASVSVTLPDSVGAGVRQLVVKGAATGTEVEVPITVAAAPQATPTMTVTAPGSVKQFKAALVRVVVRAAGMPAEGNVKMTYRGTSVTKKLDDGVVTDKLGIFKQPGVVTVAIKYLGNATTSSAFQTIRIRVIRK
ncbi:5'-nucleotidase C-terminal domain-containing protein [Nocardioides sp.]|uniref:bifunctional metallophosphatase/5'-nucleotidase n=1 Tax=Nocardioides sp. TaxID=35761 RepID=UPI00286C572A|nr:5'-nucleotidase C-terminal domain-containing protein [Nocardioides sp.]